MDSDLLEDDTDVGVAVHSARPPAPRRRTALKLVIGGVVAVLLATTSFVTRMHPTAKGPTTNAAQLGAVDGLAAHDAAPSATSSASLAAKASPHAKAAPTIPKPRAKAKAKAKAQAQPVRAAAQASKPSQKLANRPVAKQRGAT